MATVNDHPSRQSMAETPETARHTESPRSSPGLSWTSEESLVNSAACYIKNVDALRLQLGDLEQCLQQKHSIMAHLERCREENIGLKEELRREIDKGADRDRKILELRRELGERKRQNRRAEKDARADKEAKDKEAGHRLQEVQQLGKRVRDLEKDTQILRGERQQAISKSKAYESDLLDIFQILKESHKTSKKLKIELDQTPVGSIKKLLKQQQVKAKADEYHSKFLIQNLLNQFLELKKQLLKVKENTKFEILKFRKLFVDGISASLPVIQKLQHKCKQQDENMRDLTRQNQMLKQKNSEMSGKISNVSREFGLMSQLQEIYRPRLLSLSGLNPEVHSFSPKQ